MIDSVFLHEFRQANGVRLDKLHILFRKPLQLWNMNTGEEVNFKNMAEAYAYKIKDKTIEQIIREADMSLFDIVLTGGSGAKGPQSKFAFDFDGGDDEDKTQNRLPAQLNTKIDNKKKTEAEAVRVFSTLHSGDNYESGATIDANGFVTKYVKGNAHSVRISGNKGEMVLHNHPSGSNFSGADLLSTSHEKSAGVMAIGKDNTYILRKGTHFDNEKFAKAVKNAKFSGVDYNDAVHKWLYNNQKKFGYKYSRVKTDNSWVNNNGNKLKAAKAKAQVKAKAQPVALSGFDESYTVRKKYAQAHNEVVAFVKKQINVDLNKYRNGDGTRFMSMTTAFDRNTNWVAVNTSKFSKNKVEWNRLQQLTQAYNKRLRITDGGAWISYVHFDDMKIR